LVANTNPGANTMGLNVRHIVSNTPGFPPPLPGNNPAFAEFQAKGLVASHNHAYIVGYRLGTGASFRASKLAGGVNVSTEVFNARAGQNVNIMAEAHVNIASTKLYGKWTAGGTGFLGFKFNNGAGVQYGWARVTLTGPRFYDMTLVDYAYGTVGQKIATGQEALVPEPAALSLLAAGALGVLAARGWRARKLDPTTS